MFRTLGALAALAVMLLSSVAAAIVNGQPADPADVRFDPICGFASLSALNAGQQPWCNAVMIGPGRAITSGHCLDVAWPYCQNQALIGAVAGQYALRFRRRPDGSMGDYIVPIDTIHFLPAGEQGGCEDLCIASFQPDLVPHVQPMAIELDEVGPAGGALLLAGYGVTNPMCPSDANPWGQLNWCTVFRTDMTSPPNGEVHWPNPYRCCTSCWVVPNCTPACGTLAGPSNHDSGGAVMVRDGAGNLRLVGIIRTYGGGPGLPLLSSDGKALLMDAAGLGYGMASFSLGCTARYAVDGVLKASATFGTSSITGPADARTRVLCAGGALVASGDQAGASSSDSLGFDLRQAGVVAPITVLRAAASVSVNESVRSGPGQVSVSLATTHAQTQDITPGVAGASTLIQAGPLAGDSGADCPRVRQSFTVDTGGAPEAFVAVQLQIMRQQAGGSGATKCSWAIYRDENAGGTLDGGDTLVASSAPLDARTPARALPSFSVSTSGQAGLTRSDRVHRVLLGPGSYVLELCVCSSCGAGITASSASSVMLGSGANDKVTATITPEYPCGSADYTSDGALNDQDIAAFFHAAAGDLPSSDFNHDGTFGDEADLEAFFRVLGGQSCR